MNPTETNALPPDSSGPIVGYCRGTGKALTADEAITINGILYSKEYVAQNPALQEPASPYASGPDTGVPGAGASPVLANKDVSPGWAFVLGLIPGVGAIYNQQYAKGLFHIIVFGLLITLLERSGPPPMIIAFALVGWIFYMPFEAFHTAKRRQAGLEVDEMSGLFQLPGSYRRLPVGPILLIGAGFVFLLDNLGLLHIDDIIRFWPVALIAAGVIRLMQRLDEVNASKEHRHVE